MDGGKIVSNVNPRHFKTLTAVWLNFCAEPETLGNGFAIREL